MVELEREAHKLSEQQNMKQALIVASNTKMLDSITEAIAKVYDTAFVLCVGVGVGVGVFVLCGCLCVVLGNNQAPFCINFYTYMWHIYIG